MTQHSTSEIAGQAGAPTSIGLSGVISPEQFATDCRAIAMQPDREAAHHMLDQLVTELLNSLGYSEGMAVFLAHVGPIHRRSGAAA